MERACRLFVAHKPKPLITLRGVRREGAGHRLVGRLASGRLFESEEVVECREAAADLRLSAFPLSLQNYYFASEAEALPPRALRPNDGLAEFLEDQLGANVVSFPS